LHDISPYDGGVYHQAPLLLPVFSLLPDYRISPLPTHLLYIATDVLAAMALASIARSGIAHTSHLFTSSRKTSRWSTNAIVAACVYSFRVDRPQAETYNLGFSSTLSALLLVWLRRAAFSQIAPYYMRSQPLYLVMSSTRSSLLLWLHTYRYALSFWRYLWRYWSSTRSATCPRTSHQ